MKEILPDSLSAYHQLCRTLQASKRPIDLLVVTKKKSEQEILPLLHAGHRLFGENRVEEALEKWTSLKQHFNHIKLHGIGPIQSRKIKESASIFDAIQSIYRPKEIDLLSHLHYKGDIYIQINIGDEPQKYGVGTADAQEMIEYALRSSLNIAGLMCIPPAGQPASPYFSQVRTLADRYRLRTSMGMSDDFKLAITHGSDMIRVGSLVMGKRKTEASV